MKTQIASEYFDESPLVLVISIMVRVIMMGITLPAVQEDSDEDSDCE